MLKILLDETFIKNYTGDDLPLFFFFSGKNITVEL